MDLQIINEVVPVERMVDGVHQIDEDDSASVAMHETLLVFFRSFWDLRGNCCR